MDGKGEDEGEIDASSVWVMWCFICKGVYFNYLYVVYVGSNGRDNQGLW